MYEIRLRFPCNSSMPLKRTPPNTPTMSQSDSDIPNLAKYDAPEINVTTRCKRLRVESLSPENIITNDFQKEMRVMMESLQANQMAFFKKISDDVSEIKHQNLQIQQTNTCIVKNLEDMRESQEKMSRKIEKLESEKQSLVNHVQQLQTQLSDLKLNSRSSAIEVRNVPCADLETTEDILSHITGIGAATGCNTQSSDIRDVYRLPGKPGNPRTIVAEFTTVSHKNNFLAAVRKFNDSNGKVDKLNTSLIGFTGNKKYPIYISEFIPGSGRKLFYQCREFAKLHNYKFCWSANNKIYIRKYEHSKAIRVDSAAALDAVEGK